MAVPRQDSLDTAPSPDSALAIRNSAQSRQLTFESRQLIQATFRLILLCGESGARVRPGPDVDAGDSSDDGVGAIKLHCDNTERTAR